MKDSLATPDSDELVTKDEILKAGYRELEKLDVATEVEAAGGGRSAKMLFVLFAGVITLLSILVLALRHR